ncbi:hypothetical protein LTR10_017893 [Elasticomyces elasticus]|uniref:BAH domain-containing protein n=1 Tax=Exophiala sideris TaxID=1016849 RepID=A0ABR0IX31_9EURO|nr:hypothetical protein LTR10_017893 [Elasticomyces elasticus]KAK5021816.1 hypothetical protein LTS07_010711 [Exophiala sideris]KAK5025826.1 hypothetical protein LTR13_010289 [Exophiala sideris]KAK5050190.1 hypothetical protein LTR69_010677 [Exophiala sideris]KAK5177053.1 hypothetical protein LTR44_010490 [Eurotiomycetes sp. CCFEE 6388]
MASSRLIVPTEMQKAAQALFEKYRSNECRVQHESMCRPQEAPTKYAIGDKVCIRPSENKAIECWCLVATLAESKCFTAGEARHFRPMVLVRAPADGSQIFDGAGFLEEKLTAIRLAPLHNLGSSLLTSSCGLKSQVIIEDRCWLSAKYTGGPDWAYKVRGQSDKWMPESVLRPKVQKILSMGDCVTAKPAQQKEHSTGQTQGEAALQPAAKSSANEDMQGPHGSDVLDEEASQKTDKADILTRTAATHNEPAAKFDRDRADKLKAQMEDLGNERAKLDEQVNGWARERAKLEEKAAILKVQEDVFGRILGELNEKAAKVTGAAEDMEVLRSKEAEESAQPGIAAKRQRLE